MSARGPLTSGYDEIGPAFDSARTINLTLAGAAILVISLEVGWQAALVGVVPLAVALASHWARRVGQGRPVTTALVSDITVVCVTLFLTGPWETLLLSAMPFLLASAFLLLPPRRALLLMAYLAALLVVAYSLSPAPLESVTNGTLTNVTVATLFSLLLAILVATASSSLHKIRRVERHLLASERQTNLVKDQFVSMVSHELRTPLTSIAGFSETLRDGWPDLEQAEIDEFLNIINDQAIHLRDLVEDILIIPRLEAGRLTINSEDFDPAPLAHRLVGLIFPEGSTHDARVVMPGGVVVKSDPRRVEQILRNLLENARKYGGDEILVDGHREEGRFVISVTDNGPGIPREDQTRIFEHFEQVTKGDNRSDQGVGLGLPIAQRLARRLGGDLWFEEAFPHGARFLFSMELASEFGAVLPDQLPRRKSA